MHKLLIYATAIFFIFISCAESGFPEKEDVPLPVTKYSISLGMDGEILEIGETPLLTKAATGNLYGIQVYSKSESEVGYTTYYAYGLFDHADNITIELPSDKMYKFDVTMIVDGKNLLATEESKFRHPFLLSGVGGGTCLLNNVFTTSNIVYFNYLNQGNSYINEALMSATYKRPQTDRYYGTVADYTPTAAGKVSILMKRVVFGVKIVPAGFTDGKLKITMKSSPDIVMTYGVDTEITKIITFQGDISGSRWIEDSYSETVLMNVDWERSGGETLSIVSNYNLTAKRKVLHTIKLQVSGSANGKDTGLDITTEDQVMDDEEIKI